MAAGGPTPREQAALRRAVRGIRGLISAEQGMALASLAWHVPPWASIVEVGSHTGLSTLYLALGSTGAQVYAIDPWGDPRPGSRDDPFGLGTGDAVLAEFEGNLTRLGLWERVTPIRSRGEVMGDAWRAPVGLLFVDAVHTEDAVMADVLAWDRWLMPGATLALHDFDTDPAHEYYGVSRAAERLMEHHGWTDARVVDHSLWIATRR